MVYAEDRERAKVSPKYRQQAGYEMVADRHQGMQEVCHVNLATLAHLSVNSTGVQYQTPYYGVLDLYSGDASGVHDDPGSCPSQWYSLTAASP